MDTFKTLVTQLFRRSPTRGLRIWMTPFRVLAGTGRVRFLEGFA
jgi:hypothetical protein